MVTELKVYVYLSMNEVVDIGVNERLLLMKNMVGNRTFICLCTTGGAGQQAWSQVQPPSLKQVNGISLAPSYNQIN